MIGLVVVAALSSLPADAPRSASLLAEPSRAELTADLKRLEATRGPMWLPLVLMGAGAGLIVFGTASVVGGVVLNRPVVAGIPPWVSTVLLASSVVDLAAGVVLEIVGIYKLLKRRAADSHIRHVQQRLDALSDAPL